MSRQIMDYENDQLGTLFQKTNDNFEDLYDKDAVQDSKIAKKAEQSQVDNLDMRVKNLTANDGSQTEGNAELIDIRLGADGKIYETAGDAVRGQVTPIEKKLDKSISCWDFYTKKYDEGGYFFYNNGTKYESSYINAQIFNLDDVRIVKIYVVGSKYYDFYDFVDENGNSLEYMRCNSENGTIFEKILAVPDNAKKLIISGADLLQNKVWFYRNIKQQEFINETVKGYLCRYWYNNQLKTNTTNYFSSTEINCENFSKVFISGTVNPYYNYYTFLDKDKELINYGRVGGSAMKLVDYELVVPDNAVYCNVSSISNITFKGYYPRSIKNENKIKNEAFLNNTFSDKNIYWLGTSIPAGGGDGLTSFNTYPKLVGKKLGAKVTNLAVGSSPIHSRRKDLVTSDNPYGFVDSFQASSRCLTNTLEMCEWIIDHYTMFSDAPNSLSDNDKEFIRSCSYENRIEPRLAEPGIWILDHGFNDYMGDEESYTEDDKFSTFTFRGACNFIINLILSKQPKSAIYFIGVTCYGIREVQAKNQIIVANSWNIPLLKLWEHLGWSERTITTKGGWNDGIWDNNAFPDGHTLTMREIALPDGIHPHTDKTNGALNQIAMICSKWILNQGYWSEINADDFINYWNQ